MPTYEYECTECGSVVDIFHAITDPPRRKLKKTDPKPCECNATVTRRIGTGAGIIFKGNGFYQTDYRSESYKKAAKADKESAAPKSESKKDDKSAKKTPAKKKTESKKQPAKTA